MNNNNAKGMDMKENLSDRSLSPWLGVALILAVCLLCVNLLAEEGPGLKKGISTADIPSDLHLMPKTRLKTRWYTYENRHGEKGAGGKAKFGRKGAPATWIRPAGPVDPNASCLDLPPHMLQKTNTFEALNIEGPGTIRRIWITTNPRSPEVLRAVKIEMFWDGAETPAVQAPLGDFFCHSLGQMVPFQNACFTSPEGRSFNCYITMPFKKNARIVVTNQSDQLLTFFYDIACTLGDNHADDMLYFHAYWRRENMTEVRRDMTILPRIKGKGRFLGANLGIRLRPDCKHMWWGEGEVKVYLDGDEQWPTLVGTGTEDYVGSAWGLGSFVNTYQGTHYMSKKKGAWGFYRFHIPDPVYFYEDIRVDIQVMAGAKYSDILKAMDQNPNLKFMKAGRGDEYYTRKELEAHPNRAKAIESQSDYCATAYWYMDTPENGLPPLAGVVERSRDLP